MNYKKFLIGILVLLLPFGCNNEKRYKDKQGNEFIEIDGKTYIIPAEYKKTGASYKIFLLNKTDEKVNIINRFDLRPGEQKVFDFIDTDSILFGFGTKIYFGNTGLESDDKKGQIAGIGGKYWDKYNVPENVEYGFVIVPVGKGDIPPE